MNRKGKKNTSLYNKIALPNIHQNKRNQINQSIDDKLNEMENKIKRAVIMADGKYVTREDLGLAEAGELSLNLRHVRQEAERGAILRALSMTDNNISAAAKLLGVTRPTFYDLIKKYDVNQNYLENGNDHEKNDSTI